MMKKYAKWERIIIFVMSFSIVFSNFSLISVQAAVDSANATKESETDTEVSKGSNGVAPGVWSDADPHFTAEVPALSTPNLRCATAREAVANYPTYEEVYQSLIALQDTYPEGFKWDNFTPYGRKATDPAKVDGYRFKGGPIKGAQLGVGCAGFVFEASDNPFGNLPAYVVDAGNFEFKDLKVGDFLRVDNSHFVIILRITASGIIVAEANYNGTVHWGRAISKDVVMASTNFVVSRYPAGYSEADVPTQEVAHGDAGDLAWFLNNRGVLSITGSGVMPNYTADDRPSWQAYSDQIYAVEIGEGVSSVGDYAFYQNDKLISVYLPDSILSIGQFAFSETNLVSITIPEKTANVGDSAFFGCASLTSATVSEGVKIIGNDAFRACTSLEYIDFPTTIEKVGSGAFMSSKITRIRFKPGTVNVDIGDGAFTQCWCLSSVTLPSKLTKISNFMFQSCTLLGYIYIPASVTDIGENPFTSCYLQQGGLIQYGGSKSDWQNAGGNFIINSMPKTQIEYDVAFDDPFAVDPDDPGDIKFDDSDNPNPDPHQHVYAAWVIDVAATATTAGSKHRDCTVCGERETAVIPATGENPDDSGSTTNPDDHQPNVPSNPGGSGDSSGTGSGGAGSSSSGGSSGSPAPSTPILPGGSDSTTSPDHPEKDPGATTPPEDPSNSDKNSPPDHPEKPKPLSKKQAISKLKTQLKQEITPKLKRQLTKALKRQIKAKKGKISKTKLKANLKKQLKASLKKSLKSPLQKSMKKQFGSALGKDFATQFTKAYNEIFAKKFNSQFAKLFKQLYK